MRDPDSYAVFGAAPDTSNRGVSALLRCIIEGMAEAFPESRLLVFDNALGVRPDSRRLESGTEFGFLRIGARGGRRYYVPENLATMDAFSRLGRTVGGWHPYISMLDQCGAILDVSGGDSFSDIYGSHRFWSIIRPKMIANRRGIPLVLLPQTYGPFRGERERRLAAEAVLGAAMSWARDRYSFEVLTELAGVDFDPSRHREGVDMAFNLPRLDPGSRLDSEVRRWIEERASYPLLGLNISGLIALQPDKAKCQFGLRASYMDALRWFVEAVLEEFDARLLLIPHVMTPPGSIGSDVEACRKLIEGLPSGLASRIRITPTSLDECEVKWLISSTDWFCGTRMHSTIAALSSSVPTAAVAYSDKTRGVFESCGVEDQVVDPRKLDTGAVAERLLESFHNRDELSRTLSRTIPDVKSRAAAQLEVIAETLKETR